MPKLKILSGNEVLNIFLSFGFEVASRRGSHVKLRRISSEKLKQTLTIVIHSELDKGTLHAIYRQALRYIPEEKLFDHFYTK
jgi:predicted RNA binding protein YcfA (HicA-like mRNA interferase family)